MDIVTPDFTDRMIRSGELTQAQVRADNGTARPRNEAQWDKFSSWELICEEIVDNQHPPDWYDDILAELSRRGFSHEQTNRMRRFAWKTAGWLNYDKMLWDWCSLDENDIRTALDWQLKEGIINPEQHAQGLGYIEWPGSIPEVVWA